MPIRLILTVFLCLSMALPPPAAAQQSPAPTPAASPAAAQAAPPPAAGPRETLESLRVFVLDGQNAVNSTQDRTATEPVVEVRDENQQPVEGATVLFELPPIGPSGFFPGQQLTATVKTNLQGQAGALFTPNMTTGRFNIKVTATLGNRTGHATISQTNALRASEAKVAGKGLSRKWKLALIAGAAATATALIVVLTRGSSSSSSTATAPTITLTPGSPTFGAP